MKKRRTIIISLLLVAALALGIGYAATTSDLLISGGGSLASKQDDLKVVFLADPAPTTTDTTLGNASASGTRTAAFTISGLHAENQEVTFEYTIENQSNGLEVYLDDPVVSGKKATYSSAKTEINFDEYFQITTALEDDHLNINVDDDSDRTTVTVTVKLLKTIDDSIEFTANVTIPVSTQPFT
jgi:hypothetical protein